MSGDPRDKVMADHGFNRIIPGNSYYCWVTVANTLPPVPDYYATLGLDDPEKTTPEDVIAAYKALSENDINKAYKKLSIKYHPDKNPGNEEEAGKRFRLIKWAKDNLTDPASKENYDADLETYLTTPVKQVLVDYQVAVKDEHMQPTVSFVVHDHISYIEIDIPYSQDSLAGKSQKHVGVLRLNCKAISVMNLEEIPYDQVADLLPDVRKDIKERNVFYLFDACEINFENMSAESLFIHTDTRGVLDNFRSAFYDMQSLTLIIKGSKKTKDDFDYLRGAFDEERPESLFWKWYTNIPYKYRIQIGQVLKPDDRPRYDLPVRLSHHDWTDLATTYGFSALAELELQNTLAEDAGSVDFTIRLIELPFAVHEGLSTRYLALIPISSQNNFRLVSGDKLKINFNPLLNRQTQSWHRLVVESLPHTPMDTITVIITRPWSKEGGEGAWTDATEKTGAVSWRKLTDRKTAMELIAKAKSFPVKILAEYSDKVMKRNIKNLDQLSDLSTRPEIKQLLLGNDYLSIPMVDMYGPIRDEFPEPILVMDDLSPDQRAAVDLAGRAPAGQLVLVAPGGCGKTFLARQLIRPLLMSTKMIIRILSTSTVNDSLNDLALAHQEDCERIMAANPKIQPLMVTRFHGVDTEIKVARADAEKNRKPGKDARPKLHQDASEDDLIILQTLAYAAEVWDHYNQQTKQTVPGINNPRLKLVQMSLGHRMLEVAGVFQSVFSEAEKFTAFVESFRQYKNGRIFDKNCSKAFKAQTKELLEYTISRTNILVTTLFHAGDIVVTENFDAGVSLTDEGARGNLLECMVLWANFPNCKSNIHLGDPRQLKPIMKTENFETGGTNGFVAQMRTSPIAIWHANGLEVIFLRTQYRGVPTIMEIPSRAFYQGMLLHGPGTEELSRPICQRIKEYNHKHFLKDSPVVFADVKHGKQMKSGTSSYNEENAKWTLNTLADILKKKICLSKEVSIITPYGAQYRKYRTGLEIMDELLPDISARKVELAKVGAYQGRQNRVIFVDFVIEGKPGFLKEADISCVASTRAQDAEYFVGNKSAWDNFKGSNGRVLERLMSKFLPFKYTVEEKEITSPFYHEGQVDHNLADEWDPTGGEDSNNLQLIIAKKRNVNRSHQVTRIPAVPSASASALKWIYDATERNRKANATAIATLRPKAPPKITTAAAFKSIPPATKAKVQAWFADEPAKQAQKTKVKEQEPEEQEVKSDQQIDWQNGGSFGAADNTGSGNGNWNVGAQGSGSGW